MNVESQTKLAACPSVTECMCNVCCSLVVIACGLTHVQLTYDMCSIMMLSSVWSLDHPSDSVLFRHSPL